MSGIGKYEFIREIGRGGMGMVFQARDKLMDRVVAVKLMTGEDIPEDVRTRFYREAQAAGNLRHPNIVTIHDLAEEAGVPYIVMEYLEGMNLRQVLRGQPDLPLAIRLGLAGQIAAGLSYAHRKGVIHRDVKPENIWVDEAGEVKILDFGLARFVNSDVTKVGMVMGSVPYMSPEQTVGKGVDHRTDIWALGVVLYELVARRRPFEGETVMEIAWKINSEPPPPLSAFGVNAPRGLEAAILRALSKDQTARWNDAAELRAEIERCGVLPMGPVPPAPTPRPTPPPTPKPAPPRVSWQQIEDRVRPSVVAFSAPEGKGTAFVVAPGGFAMTCRHLVLNTLEVRVRLPDGREVQASVKGTDQPADLAVIQLPEDVSLPVLTLADDSAIEVGQGLMIAGFAPGAALLVARGLVTARGRIIDGIVHVIGDVDIRPGCDGAPMVNENGLVVGVANGRVSAQKRIVGLGVAASRARALLTRLKVKI